MEECESLDPEMTELEELQCEASEAISQDDEDEVEELQNSLREIVQDQSVKPKLQCLMVDPSFSMVTVQSEDSGIVWETASSRCSTPWASETSSTSEAYSMEGSGAAGKITIVFDEEKVVRRRTRSGGRSSRLGDRLSRPGSSRSASALGVERPEMAEVSLPNVKQEKTETGPDLEEIKNKDQQLFSLISEGYEILNIRVPSKLPTVDEEESTELQDNLSYLDETPKIKSRNHHDWTQQENHVLPEEGETQAHQEASEQIPSHGITEDTELKNTPTQKESTSDIDYFEKFTLLDEVAPGEQGPNLQEEAKHPAATLKAEEQKPAKEAATDSPSTSEDSFVFVTDVEIVGEHLDEVFYGEGAPADTLQQREDDEDEAGMRMRRESQRSVKENGSVLFGSEETILTPIYISPGPPKIIDPILLEEPTAMSFMYSDLYEDAVGERRRSDEEYSEAESVASEKSYKRRLSDSEEPDGYLEKFILKDETPALEDQPESSEDEKDGRKMWSQNKFEMTGCLMRVREEDEDEKKKEEPKPQEVSVADISEDFKTTTFEEKCEIVTGAEKQEEEIQPALETEEQTVTDAPEESSQTSKLGEDQMEDQEVKDEVKRDQTDPPESSIDESLHPAEKVESKVEQTQETEEHQREKPPQTASDTETQQPCQTQEVVEKTAQVDVNDKEQTAVIAPLSSEAPHILTKSEIPPETTEECLSEVAAADTETVVADERVITEDVAEAPAEVQEHETEIQETASAETEPLAKTADCEEKEAIEVKDPAPVEVITDCDSAVHAIVEVTEKAVDEKVMQTQVQIDLQDVASVEASDVQKAAPEEEEEEHKALTEETTAESQVPEFITEADQESEVKTEISSEVTEPVTAPEEAETDLDKNQQEESVTDCESDKTKLITETRDKTPTVDTGSVVQETVAVGDELILLVPKGQAVEMDIEINQWSEKISDTVAFSEADSLVAPEPSMIFSETLQAPIEEAMTEPQLEETGAVLKEEAEIDSRYSPPAPVEEADAEEQPEKQAEEQPIEQAEDQAEEKVEKQAEEQPIEQAEEQAEENVEKQAEEQAEEQPIEQAEEQAEERVEKQAEEQTEEQPIEQTEEQTEEQPIEQAEEQTEEQPIEQAEEQTEEQPIEQTEEQTEEQPIEQAEEQAEEEQKQEYNSEEEKCVVSSLSSFTPQEDLSWLHGEDVQSKTAEQKAEVEKVEEAPEAIISEKDTNAEIDLHKEDTEKKMESDEAFLEAPEATVDELEYEVISKQDAKEMLEPEIQRDAEEPKPYEEKEVEMEEKAFDLLPEEEPLEAEYEIIDAEEESQARLAAELEGMDWFCLTCGCLLLENDTVSGEHHNHEMTSVDKAYEEIKERLSDWISELQGRSENIEDLVSELELAYNSVEDQFVENEAAMQVQNEEMMALVMEQYNSMSVSMEEEKKAKLEQLYDQIVTFQESIDTAKVTLETTAREAETDARPPEDIHERLKAALDSAMSLELGPTGLLVFEDYAKGNTSSSHLTQRKGIPVPQKPTLQPQEPGSATSTSVTVYWRVSPGDIIDCFQVYCMEDPQGAVSEEYRVTVKESYCVLEELEPDKTYKVWVMAVNYTGCSLPSERLCFRTAPSVPVIDTEHCTVMWDSATLRWSSAKQSPEHSYTLEYCRQYELEGEGLRSISGIRRREQKVVLQPNESYLFYIKAVNEAGASEQSEAALISTKGTRFHLLKDSAHPALELSVDHTTVHYSQDAPEHSPSTNAQCPSILGELLLGQGRYYWETIVSGSTAYRLGVAYSTVNRNSPLGENSQSWCLQCVPTPSGCRYQLIHNDVQSTVFVIEMPERVGILLDYQLGCLTFYNAQSGQLLGAFCHHFTQPCHPALALEMPGSLEVSMVLEAPEFTKDS